MIINAKMQPRFPFSRGVRRSLTVPLAAAKSVGSRPGPAFGRGLQAPPRPSWTRESPAGRQSARHQTSGTPNPVPAAAQPAPEPAPPQVIPLPEVWRCGQQELTQTLSDVAATLPPAETNSSELSNAISQYGAAVECRKRKEADALLAELATSLELREQENYWRAFQTSRRSVAQTVAGLGQCRTAAPSTS